MSQTIGFALALLMSLTGSAQADTGSLLADDSTFQQIFKDTSDTQNMRAQGDSIEFEPQLALRSIQSLALSNGYFDVPYSDSLRSVMTFQLTTAFFEDRIGQVRWSPILSLSYSYHEGIVGLRSQRGVALRDLLRLHWLTTSLGIRASHDLPLVRGSSFFMQPGLGMQLLSQGGSLDGINQAFWVPEWELGAGLAFFEPKASAEAWFRGVTVSATRAASLSSEQKASSWKSGLGVRLAL